MGRLAEVKGTRRDMAPNCNKCSSGETTSLSWNEKVVMTKTEGWHLLVQGRVLATAIFGALFIRVTTLLRSSMRRGANPHLEEEHAGSARDKLGNSTILYRVFWILDWDTSNWLDPSHQPKPCTVWRYSGNA